MKTTHVLLMSAIAFPLVGAGQSSAPGVVASSSPPPGSHERVEMTVLKVFSAKDGDAIFRGYLVSWKNQEVVVSDPLAQTDYHVGDTVGVLVMKLPYPNGEKEYGLLDFLISPKGR